MARKLGDDPFKLARSLHKTKEPQKRMPFFPTQEQLESVVLRSMRRREEKERRKRAEKKCSDGT